MPGHEGFSVPDLTHGLCAETGVSVTPLTVRRTLHKVCLN